MHNSIWLVAVDEEGKKGQGACDEEKSLKFEDFQDGRKRKAKREEEGERRNNLMRYTLHSTIPCRYIQGLY